MRSLVANHGQLYLSSFPGRDNGASNAFLHNAVLRLLQGKDVDFDQLEKIHTQLEYRLKAIATADIYVSAIGLLGPGGLRCSQWNMATWAQSEEARQFNNNTFHAAIAAVAKCGLFPQPMVRQGKQFTKPNDYVAAAFMVAKLKPEKRDQLLAELVSSDCI